MEKLFSLIPTLKWVAGSYFGRIRVSDLMHRPSSQDVASVAAMQEYELSQLLDDVWSVKFFFETFVTAIVFNRLRDTFGLSSGALEYFLYQHCFLTKSFTFRNFDLVPVFSLSPPQGNTEK